MQTQQLCMRSVAHLLSAITCLVFCLPPSSAKTFSGTVIGVTDGDTISVMHNGVPEKIRLGGIDCPEKRQAFGAKAKQFTSSLVFGKTVVINEQGKDKYGRTIGEVFTPEGESLNRRLVQEGLAWWYKQYSNDRSLSQLEATARSSGKGLWAEANTTAPWLFRKFGKTPTIASTDYSDVLPFNRKLSRDQITTRRSAIKR